MRESPMNYQRLNELIRDNDQGVVKRVQQEVLHQAQSLTSGANSSFAQSTEAPSRQDPASSARNTFSFSFTKPATRVADEMPLFTENRSKDVSLLERMHSSGSASKQPLIAGKMTPSRSEPPADWRELTIKGTCQTLEKTYFRLTSAPDPADVRPEEVLKRAFEWITRKWTNKQADYKYVDD